MKLEAKHIVKKYRSRTVVNDVSFEVNQGEIVGLLGPNGAGKTTSFYTVVGLIRPYSGEVLLDGRSIQKMPMLKRAQLGIGYLAQEASVFRKLSVEDNIKGVLEMTKLSKSAQADRLEELLEEFGLAHIRTTRGDLLSGGERRRLFLLTILMKNPNFLILDEPTNDLDILTLQALEGFLEEYSGCLLVVSHDRYFLDKLCDHLFVFEGGGRIKDFNGRYYEWREEQKRIDAIRTTVEKEVPKEEPKKEKVKTKLSYMEKREWDELPGQIEALEARRDALNAVFEGAEQDPEEVAAAAEEIKEVLAELDEKEMRWLELSEFDYE